MLESTCDICYTPVMRSKSLEYVCVTCSWSKFIKANDEVALSQIGKPPTSQKSSNIKLESSPVKEPVIPTNPDS